MVMHSCRVLVLSVASIYVWISSVPGVAFGLTCDSNLPSTNTVITVKAGQPCLHSIDLPAPRIVEKIVLDLQNCGSGNNYQQSNILLEYIDGTDVTRTKRKRLVAFTMNQYNQLYYKFDQSLYADDIFITTDAMLECAVVLLYGCSSSGLCPVGRNPCYNGGTCVGNYLCACAKGFMGARCEKSTSHLVVDDYTYIRLDGRHWLVTNNGDFETHGNVTFNSVTKKRHTHHDTAIYIHGTGGHCHLQQTHGGIWRNPANYYSGSTHSVFSGHNPSGFTHHGAVMFEIHHDHSHEVHFYNTHHNFNPGYPGSSLVYSGHTLSMHVNTGSRQYQLSVSWYPGPTVQVHHVASSFSPQYGCSIYVDGNHMGSVTDSVPARSSSSSPESLCMGSCGYNYISSNNGLTIPYARYWMGSMHAAGMCWPQLTLNNKCPVVGLTLPVPQRIPTLPPPTTMPTTTTTVAPTTTTATTTTTTIAPTTTTMTTTVPTVPTTMASTGHMYSATGGSRPTALSQSGPLCYSCTKSSADGRCTALRSCQHGEVCALFHDPSGYTHTCLDKTLCNSAKSLTHSDCWKCCDYSLCNNQCAPAVACEDTKNCALLMSTGYNVCSDPKAAAKECKKSCGLC